MNVGGGGGSNNSSAPIEKHGNDLYDIHELQTDFGLSSFMQIRSLKSNGDTSTSSLLFKCLAKNDYGISERLIKLIVLNRPDKPEQVKVRDIWSRSALVTWSSPSVNSANTNSNRISNYTVQYWRKNHYPHHHHGANGAPQQQQHQQMQAQQQNHRREEIVVDGLQNSALLINLMPSVTYELSIIAFNQVGFSDPSDIINITTSEEEPSLPPTDVVVEAKGSATLRVLWKTPPLESLNGKLLGFYIGYRPRLFNSLANNQLIAQSNNLQNLIGSSQQQQQIASQQQQQQPSMVYSFKTADAVENQLYYDAFLTGLKSNHDYEITIRAFNKAGSGPDCHTLLARTNSAKLPQAPQLQLQKVTATSVTLKWSATVLLSNSKTLIPSQQDVIKYILFYQLQGDRDWFELNVQSSNNLADNLQQQQLSPSDSLKPAALASSLPLEMNGQSATTNDIITSQANVHTLSNLQSGLVYRIYVSAVNDYGVGDPSNILTIRTDASPASQAYLGAALLDLNQPGTFPSSSSATSLFDNLIMSNQQHYGLIFTTLSSISVLILLILFVLYLIYQYKLKNKYHHSSSASSYPSSWTPAATDTIQSEYSINKRFPLASNSSAAAATNALLQEVANYDEVANQQQQQMRLNQTSSRQQLSNRISSNGNQVMRSYNSKTMNRPILSSHYHQPADLISSSNSAATLQLQNSGRGQQSLMTTTTLNRNQNRQLPPIPYSTLSVKEIGNPNQSSKQWRQQHQQQQQTNNQIMIAQQGNYSNNKSNVIGSQTPLIYGVIE